MIPVTLRISGFLSYQEAVELDFNGCDVACISGANGAGKSSLLDAITWALFGKARRTDDAIINSSSRVKAAEVIYDFRYEGYLYRVQRAKPREKTTVLEFAIRDDGGNWRSLTEKSVRATEERIRATLRMDFDTFTNASFLLQGRADQFAQQAPGERKKVLSSILGLEVWEEYRAAAAARRKGLETELKAVELALAEINTELADEPNRKTRLADMEARLETAKRLRQASEANLANVKKLAVSLEEQRRMLEVREQAAAEQRHRWESQTAELAELRKECERYRQILADEMLVHAHYQRWQELRAQLERWDVLATNFREIEAQRSGPLNAIAAESARLDAERNALSVQEESLRRDQERLPDLEAQLQLIAAQMQECEQQLAARAELEDEMRKVEESRATANAENKALWDQMNALKERIGRLKEAEGAQCPLCGQPLSLEDRVRLVAELEASGKEMGDRYRANQKLQGEVDGQLADLRARRDALGGLEGKLRALAREHDRLEVEIQRIRAAGDAWAVGGALRLAEILRKLSAGEFALDARMELAQVDARSQALGYDPAAHDALRREELSARSAEGELRALESARGSLAPLERQISGLEAQQVESAARLAEKEQEYEAARARYAEDVAALPDVNQAEREAFQAQSDENRLNMEVGMARQAVAVLDQQRRRRTAYEAQRAASGQGITRLKALERAFSKDGVPAMLIEQALPEIEAHANEILDRLSNGTMSVRFATQRQYKDKGRDDRKETLDIIISDDAGEREYEMFSGGEAFRVNFAIRLALSRVLAQRAGARLQTLVIDEGFGSQDANGRQRLIEAINLVRPEFAKILVITHLEELKEAFPARIEVEKGPDGSSVRVVT
jgi:exonuclease SbcC